MTKKINKRIEIVSTTKSSLSSMGLVSRRSVHRLLSQHYSDVRITILNSMSDLQALANRQPDLVFLGMSFLYNDPLNSKKPAKIWLSDYLDELGIAYTGSGQIAHALERNKAAAKQRIHGAGLRTARFYVAKQTNSPAKDKVALTFPVFIKPLNCGGGQGIDDQSVAYNLNQLQSKVQSIADGLLADSLIEEYLPGREFSVAVMKSHRTAELLVMPVELITEPDQQGLSFLSKQVKSSNSEQVIAVDSGIINDKVCELAVKVFYTLGARDYGRIDIRLDRNSEPHFLEANLIPSLISGYGSFPKACWLNMGMDYEQMILNIVDLGLSRNIEDPGEQLEDNWLLSPSFKAA